MRNLYQREVYQVRLCYGQCNKLNLLNMLISMYILNEVNVLQTFIDSHIQRVVSPHGIYQRGFYKVRVILCHYSTLVLIGMLISVYKKITIFTETFNTCIYYGNLCTRTLSTWNFSSTYSSAPNYNTCLFQYSFGRRLWYFL